MVAQPDTMEARVGIVPDIGYRTIEFTPFMNK